MSCCTHFGSINTDKSKTGSNSSKTVPVGRRIFKNIYIKITIVLHCKHTNLDLPVKIDFTEVCEVQLISILN